MLRSRNLETISRVVLTRFVPKPNRFDIPLVLSSNSLRSFSLSSVQRNTSDGSKITSVDTSNFDSFDSLKEEGITQVTSAVDGISNSLNPVNWAQDLLMIIHDFTGLPWWVTIALVSFTIRSMTFPLAVKARRATVNMANNREQIQKIQTSMRDIISSSRDGYKNPQYQQLQEKLIQMQEKGGYTTSDLFKPMVSAPFFIVYFLALRGMAAQVESFTYGGTLWFTNLALPDPFALLPIINAMGVFTSFKISQSKIVTISSGQQYLTWLMAGISLLSIPFTMYLPSAIFMYWIPSSLFAVCQNYYLSTDAAKKRHNIPAYTVKSPKEELEEKMKGNSFTNFLKRYFPQAEKLLNESPKKINMLTKEEVDKVIRKKDGRMEKKASLCIKRCK
jgi:YidC/Oxa1 family membrane protein insertase